jgi:hypothetical protein
MTVDELDYWEKVKIPEYASYGWIKAAEDMLLLIAEIRKLRGRAGSPGYPAQTLSERSEEAK